MTALLVLQVLPLPLLQLQDRMRHVAVATGGLPAVLVKASQQHRCSHQDSASCQGSNGHPELAVALRLSLQLLSLLAGIGSPACLRAILTPAGSLVALLKRLSHQGSQVARQRKPLSEVDQKCRSPRQCC